MPADLGAVLNPFFQGIVTEAWMKAPADVPEINELAFRHCMAAVDLTRKTGTSNAVILHGETGSGKTHLLSRLREALAAGDPDGQPVFVYVMLAAGASRLRRLVRERFVDSLLRPWREHPSRLAALLRNATGGRPWAEAAAGLGLGYGMTTVLGHVLENRFPTATASWLRGESLPDSVLDSLGLADAVEGDDADEERLAFESIRALCRLAEPRPVVFCCDQAEALRAGLDDKQGFFVYGQLCAAIRNMIGNAVVISSIQTVLLGDFRNGMQEADYQRLGSSVVLQPIDRRQGRLLLAKRLDAEPSVAAARAAGRHGALWPIDEQKLETAYDLGGRTAARRLLYRAAELFEELRNGTMPDSGGVDAYLDQKLEKFRGASKAWESPAQTDAILEHGLPVLATLLGRRLKPAAGKGMNVTAGGAPISLCSQANQAALTRRLGQLAASGQMRMTLVRDVRLDIRKTPRAAAHLEKLTNLQARWVRPTAEALAALDALQRLHNGYSDLSHAGEPVPQATVANWLRDNLPAAAATGRGVVRRSAGVPLRSSAAAVEPGIRSRCEERGRAAAGLRRRSDRVCATPFGSGSACHRAESSPVSFGWPGP